MLQCEFVDKCKAMNMKQTSYCSGFDMDASAFFRRGTLLIYRQKGKEIKKLIILVTRIIISFLIINTCNFVNPLWVYKITSIYTKRKNINEVANLNQNLNNKVK